MTTARQVAILYILASLLVMGWGAAYMALFGLDLTYVEHEWVEPLSPEHQSMLRSFIARLMWKTVLPLIITNGVGVLLVGMALASRPKT